jgi:uncharacterized protein (DUF1330 family)
MKTYYTVALSMLAGVGVGVVAVQTLHAPKAQAVLKAAGGRFLAAGQKVTALEGEPPKTRVTIQVWESLDKMKAAYASAEYKEARKIGDKYAKFRAFAVEGLPQ